MKQFFLIGCCILSTYTVALAQSSAEGTNQYCKSFITSTERYLAGFGEIILQGEPLQASVDWSVPFDTLVIRFPSTDITLTAENTPPPVLGDYIATTIAHTQRGLIPFGVISDDLDGNQIGLIQPFEVDGQPGCFASVVSTH